MKKDVFVFILFVLFVVLVIGMVITPFINKIIWGCD